MLPSKPQFSGIWIEPVDRKRNHKAEYARRIARGLAKGLTRSEARGHPALAKKSKTETPQPDPRLEIAVREMNTGSALTTAARKAHISPERLRTFIATTGIARRKGRGWVMRDTRTRRVQIISESTSKTIYVRGFKTASQVGKHAAAYRDALDGNGFKSVSTFRGKGVRDLKGKLHLFETDPNELMRYAQRDEPQYHEIYSIIQP